MSTVLSLIQLFVTLALIGVVLIQRSEGGGLGIGSSQGMGSFMTGRGTANLLTRTTAILAGLFMALSLILAMLNKGTVIAPSILDVPPPPVRSAPAVPAPAPGPNPGPKPAATIPPAAAPETAPSAPAPVPPPASSGEAPASGGAGPAETAPGSTAPPPNPAPSHAPAPSVPTN